jgi:hypothetical protein
VFNFLIIEKLLIESGRSLGNEKSTVGLGRSLETVRQGESELGSQDLLDVLATDIGILNLGNANDLDRSEASTVTSSHILV